MKINIKKMIVLLISFLPTGIYAGSLNNGYCDPDSLTPVTISGKAVVVNVGLHSIYYLDEDGDNVNDYILNFGPFWYEPENSSATRPLNGDYIVINGGVNESSSGPLAVIVVYDINSLFWRNPYEPFWNQFNNDYCSYCHTGPGYSTGAFMDTNLNWIETEGAAILDTTFKYVKYYLDTNYDSIPDYKLNFGPPWYIPLSSIALPESGDTIKIKGILLELHYLDAIVVSELDDIVWRDSLLMGHQMAGRWMHRNMMQERYIYSPFDTSSKFRIMHNWHMGPLPDSLFCQIISVFPQNMHQFQHNFQHAFAAFEIGTFNKNQGHYQNIMMSNNWRISMNNSIQYQFRYTHQQLEDAGIRLEQESTIRVRYWQNGNSWVEPTNYSVDTLNNLITFSSSELNGLFIVTADLITSIDKKEINTATIGHIYPNPTSNGFYIPFTLNTPAHVMISLHDMTGRNVMSITDETYSSGEHRLFVDQNNLRPGIYFSNFVINGQSVRNAQILIIK